MVFDEDRYFSGAWRLEDAGELRYGLLKDLRWTNVNFRDYNHDRHVKRECNPQMLSKKEFQLLAIQMRKVSIAYLLMPISPLFAATMSRQ